jgi:hypothetical protein
MTRRVDNEAPADEGAIDRTTSLGLFNYARAYHLSASHLAKAKIRAGHAHAPVSFLYYHSIELYLKSFLRLRETSVESLRKLGHRLSSLATAATERGLFLMDEDREVISLISADDMMIRARYIRTGFSRQPANEALERTCASLHETVRDALRKSHVPVRDFGR